MHKIIKELQKYEPKSMTMHQLPVIWDSAVDSYVWDINNKQYIDFTSTIFVANSGHSNTEICNALRKQINKKLLHSYTFPTEIRLKFMKKLSSFSGFDKAFLVSAGTEATEAACKIMKEYTGRPIIASFQGSMHGKTYLAENLRGSTEQNKWATEPPNPSFEQLSYPSGTSEFLGFRAPDRIAGIMIESYRGWDVNFFNREYIQDLIRYCSKHKILVCFDEIQAGIGRTGKRFAYEHYDVKPDLVCLGKGLGGGVPISAVLGGRKLLDTPIDLSSTHSANPLVCAAALANLEYIEKHDIIEEAHKKGKVLGFIENFCWESSKIKKVNYSGLVGALICNSTETADKICYKAMEKGLLCVHTGRESVKIGPPLTISPQLLLKGLHILEECVKEVEND